MSPLKTTSCRISPTGCQRFQGIVAYPSAYYDLNGRVKRHNPTEKQAPKLLDQVRDRIRVKHYSLRTEDAYLGWIKRFILFHNKRHTHRGGHGVLSPLDR